MRIECRSCGATYDVSDTTSKRVARCQQCGSTIRIPTGPESAATTLDAPAGTERSRPVVVSVLALLFSVIAALQSFLCVAAFEAAAETGAWPIAAFAALMTACPVLAAVGLWLLKPWGWWAALVIAGATFVMNAKFLAHFLLALNWDHSKAGGVARDVIFTYGVPALLAGAVLAMLFLSKVRIALGVKDRPRARRRRVVARKRNGQA